MLIKDDCLVALKGISENSIDSLVTDPPAGISFMGKQWDSGNNFIPAMTKVFKECLRVMKPGAHGLVWALPRTSHWTATALEAAGFEVRDVVTHIFGSGFPKSFNLGNGWGTALKPASEHWILIRKPCSEKTVAANTLKHGTGGINIDGCRIESNYTETELKRNFTGFGRPCENKSGWAFRGEQGTVPHSAGRFPANLVLSHNEDCEESPHVFADGSTQSGCTEGCAVKMLDVQSGVLKNGGPNYAGGNRNSMFGNAAVIEPTKFAGDSGGASRFFYCAKASKKDREEGNNHPTVKSTKLMEYLITLVTPPNGTVLDPFMGSGSTGKAAIKLGFKFIGIEKEQEYFEIAEKRITACSEAISNV